MLPCVPITRECHGIGQAFVRNHTFKRFEPVPVISRTGIGIAQRLRTLDLVAQHVRPFRPSEKASLLQGDRYRESVRLPRGTKNGAVLVARNAL